MRKWILALALVCALVVFVLVLSRSKTRVRLAPESSPTLATTNKADGSGGSTASSKTTHQFSPGSTGATAAASIAIAAAANVRSGSVLAPNVPPMPEFTNFAASIVMENVRTVFRQYSSTFGGNPVGTNPEITRALNGGNPKEVKFIKAEDGLRINSNGELVDSWGTPFFFHQLSGTQMEIHSAGPDRMMWTSDDLVVK